jgi:hypothetical protein
MAEQVATIGRARRRRQSSHPPSAADSLPPAWPPAWRELATHWLRRDTVRAKWPTLLATAGGDGFETAHDLLAALLDGGWIAIEETWRDDRWQALWVEFLDLPALRRALGLPAPGDRKAAQEAPPRRRAATSPSTRAAIPRASPAPHGNGWKLKPTSLPAASACIPPCCASPRRWN